MILSIQAGGNLQAALDSSQPGDVLELEAGATFQGNFTLPVKPSGLPILVRAATSGQDATIRTPNNLPALATRAATAGWRFLDARFAADATVGDIVRLGTGTETELAALPRDIQFDRCWIAADQTAKNGLTLNAIDVVVRNASITGVKLPASSGIETHAIVGTNGPGPFLIEDCHIEAGSIGVLFGGAKPGIVDLVPSDVAFRRNEVTRPLEMHLAPWGVKNLFELKNARRVTVTGNVFEHNWPDAQSGYAIVFTVRANSLTAPWSTIEDVLFESNIVRHVAMAFNVLGLDNALINGQPCPSTPMDRVVIRNNLIYDLDRLNWKKPNGDLGSGVFMAIDGGPRNLHVENNTAVGAVTGNILSLAGPQIPGFVFRRNIVQKQTKTAGFPYDTYGIYGNAVGEGNVALATFAPDAVVTQNVLAGCTPTAYSKHPGNVFPSVFELVSLFADPAAGDYRAGLEAGCDQDAIEAAQKPPVAEPPSPSPILTNEEIVRACAVESEMAMAEIGGDVSPQDAARQAISYYREALLLALAEPT